MNLLFYATYVLSKKTIKEQFIEELEDVWEMFADFFNMIKSLTYDKIANIFGTGATGIIFGMIIVIIICFVLMKIINH
jgi:acid phosphatase family membrane protein YuiD